MVNKALRQVIDNIYVEKERLKKEIEAEKDEFKKHDLNFEFEIVCNERFNEIYHQMIESISDDKIEETKAVIVKLLGSEENFDRLTKNVLVHFPNATSKDFFKGVSSNTVNKNFDSLIDDLSNLVTDEEMNKIAKSVEKFIPGSINNNPIHPCARVIAEIKNSEKFNNLSQSEKTAISKQLDDINEVVKESPRRFSDAQTEFDKEYESIINADNNKFFIEYVNDKNNDFGKAFDYYDLSFTVKDDVADDEEKINIALSPKFQISKQTQDSILKVWKKMDELNIITAGNGAESGAKIYGFDKLYKARQNIDNALKNEDFSNLKTLKDEYEKQLQNLREMYKLIKIELNPTPDKIPGNVQNFRENFVPAEFKNDISINAAFNAMYNAYSIVKSMGISGEEFLSSPQKYIDEKFNGELTKFHIDKYYKDVSFNETLARVYSDKTKPGINSHGMPRMVSTLTLFEKDADQKKQNLIYHAIQSGKIGSIYEDDQICYNYFSKGKTNSFINLLFVNPEDRDFQKLKSYDSVTSDKLHKTRKFDLASYLKEKNISADAIYERITSYVETAYKISYAGEKKFLKDKVNYDKAFEKYKKGIIKKMPNYPTNEEISRETFSNMIKDIQQGVIDFVMLSNAEKNKNMDKLVEILKNPAEAFKSLNLSDSYIEDLNKLKNKDAVLNEYKLQAKLENKLDIEDVRLKEKTYNNTVDKILKEANKISLKVARESDAKKVEELQKQSVIKMNELKQLQKTETERLNKEYKAGHIPGDYYKNRVENILSLNHNKTTAIFDDGLDKKEYIKSTGLENLSKAEINTLYKCEIENQKVERELFANQQFLQNHNLISTNRDVEAQKGNFEQIDVAEIDSTLKETEREPLVVDEAKIEKTNEKTEPQKEIDPKQTIKMP